MNKTKFKNQKIIFGSVLVFALITLGITVALALGIVQVTVTDRKTSLSTEKSNSAFQQADSGAEAIIKEYLDKKSLALVKDSFSSDCDPASGKIKISNYEITLKNNAGVQIRCDDATGKKIKDIASIQSAGISQQQSRSVDYVPPCAGFNPDDNNPMVGWWKFESASAADFVKDFSSTGNNAQLKNVGASNPSRYLIGGKYGVITNNLSSPPPGNNRYNYVEIPGVDAYKSQIGAISFWFYDLNANPSTTAWVPFSKSAFGCDKRGIVKELYIDVNLNGINDGPPTDIVDPAEVNKCNTASPLFNKDDCDCGHLEIGFNGDKKIINSDDVKDKFVAKFKNDGNWGGYALAAPGSTILSDWKMATVTYSGSDYKLYIDGKFQYAYSGESDAYNNPDDTDGMEALLNNKFNINLGIDNGKANKGESYFKGVIRDLRIYKGDSAFAADPACVKKLYNDTQ